MTKAPLLLLIFLGGCRRPSSSDHDVVAALASPVPALPALASAHIPAPPAAPPPAAAPPAPPPLPPLPAAPFGAATAIPRYSCAAILAGGPFHSFLATSDTRLAFVDGNEGLALVNRSPTGALPPSYAPGDLVDLQDGRSRPAAECDSGHECLRRDAAAALKSMLGEMQKQKMPGQVVSSFRGFGTQCWVFAGWANKARGGFCEATAQSALPGHSQHQLGTTVDLFTNEWAARGAQTGEGVFRNGFGCTAGGKWLDEQAWRFGFVLPYPIHPDDRKDGSRCEARRDRAVPINSKTGYKNEPWHLRFIGTDAAARYHEAWLASGPGTPGEITLEQWLREERGLKGDAELPVCDGCQCGACATLAQDDKATPCGKESLRLDGAGRVVSPEEEPSVLDARATRLTDGLFDIVVTVHAPAHTPTQPPVTGPDGPPYGSGATFLSFAPYSDTPRRPYEELRGAWRVGVEPVPPESTRWPWRASLADAKLAETWNRANVVLPAKSGDDAIHVRAALPAGTHHVRVALLRDGSEHGIREIDVP